MYEKRGGNGDQYVLSPAVRRLLEEREDRKRYAGPRPRRFWYDIEPDKWSLSKADSPDAFRRAVDEYNEDNTDPRLVTNYWRKLWTKWGKVEGRSFEVPDVDYSRDELACLREEGSEMVYMPQGVGWRMLDKLAPSLNLRANAIILDHLEDSDDGGVKSGWLHVERALVRPNKNHTEREAIEMFRAEGRAPLDFVTYGISTISSKVSRRSYLDEVDRDINPPVITWTRLPGSRLYGRCISVQGSPSGNLRISTGIDPDNKDINIGARSKGAKR